MAESMFDLSGKVAIVTGGNGGIGLAIAEALGRAGAKIVIAARNEEKGQEAIRKLRIADVGCAFVRCELGTAEASRNMVEDAVRCFGRCDILVANAGISIRKLPQDITEKEWHQVVSTNLDASFFCAQAVYPHMKHGEGGKILFLGSMYSLFGAPMVAPYAASKGGVVQLTKALASAWAPDQIQVNAILPGWIDTDLTVKAREQVDDLDAIVRTRTPAGRWGRPEDIGTTAVYLASPASSFVTGASIPVDGGYSARG